jgi:hypothetical protein
MGYVVNAKIANAKMMAHTERLTGKLSRLAEKLPRLAEKLPRLAEMFGGRLIKATWRNGGQTIAIDMPSIFVHGRQATKSMWMHTG